MPLLKVRARRPNGFWRAKRFWPREWVTAELSDDDALAVMEERWLECEEIKPEQAQGLRSSEEAQPSLDPPPPPKVFDDPKLAERQEDLLREEAAKTGEPPRYRGPDLSDESLPRETIDPSEKQSKRRR